MGSAKRRSGPSLFFWAQARSSSSQVALGKERLLATLHVYVAEANNFFVVFNYLAKSQNYFDAKLAFYQEAIHHIRVMLLMKNLKGSTGSTTWTGAAAGAWKKANMKLQASRRWRPTTTTTKMVPNLADFFDRSGHSERARTPPDKPKPIKTRLHWTAESWKEVGLSLEILIVRSIKHCITWLSSRWTLLAIQTINIDGFIQRFQALRILGYSHTILYGIFISSLNTLPRSFLPSSPWTSSKL